MVLKILAARAERRRAAELAKARSDEIDRQIKEEARTFKGLCDLLLVGSWSFIALYGEILSLGLALTLY